MLYIYIVDVTPIIPWIIPESVEAGAPREIESKEKKIQSVRLSRKPVVFYKQESDIPSDPIASSADNRNASSSIRGFTVIPWEDASATQWEDTNSSNMAESESETTGLFLDLLPEYVKDLKEDELERLTELLMSDDYSYLLEDSSSSEFLALVDSVAPGTAAAQQNSWQQQFRLQQQQQHMYYPSPQPSWEASGQYNNYSNNFGSSGAGGGYYGPYS